MCTSKRREGLPVCRAKAVLRSFLIFFKTLDIGPFPARTQVSHSKRETSTGLRSVFYHACTGVSLTTNNLLVTCDTTYRTGLRDDNCGLKHFQCAVSTGHPRSTENKTGFENQSVSATNVVGGNMDEHVEAGRGLSLSCYFSFVVRELN